MRVAIAGPVQMAALAPHLDVRPGTAVPPGLGGTPISQLAVALLRAGHEVLVVTLDTKVNHEVVLEGPGLRVKVGPYRQSDRARDAFRRERHAITAALEREVVDLVHAHWSYEYALGALRTSHPTVVTVRDWAPTILRLTPNAYRVLRLAMNVRVLQRARHFTVTSPYMHARLSRWVGGDIPVIPNALDDRHFTQPRTYPDRPPVFVAVNDGFSKRKNVVALLQAFRMVRRRITDARLVLVGKAHGVGEQAHQWATARGLGQHVEFLGPIDHAAVLDRIGRAHALVHPALEESFGMVLVEAMSQGTPVIGGRNSGAVPWVVGDGHAGLLVDVERPVDIATAMVELVADPARWEQQSARGINHARARFTTSVVVDRYVECYREVLHSATCPPLTSQAAGSGRESRP